MRFAAGQRWISEPEPELGLGIVLGVEPGRVKFFFPASNAMRLYAEAAAPLRRVRFKAGDTVRSHEGASFVVAAVEERADGVLVYSGPGGEALVETQLSDILAWDKPGDRIAGAQVDDNAAFDLRRKALGIRHRLRQSPAHGFTGARIDLIPHQLAIAREAAARPRVRVLLADEVGLGKTIEACLILHRLHLTGRADRVLILLPEPLLHQWFFELYRRFNLRFALFDEARCAAIAEGNPFLDDQLILAPLDWLAHNELRRRQAAEAGWDLVVVDEAHHLAVCSAEYSFVETLGNAAPHLLLLTATPRQLGLEGHFARLRLLDPERYPTLKAYKAELEQYESIAQLAGKLEDENNLAELDKLVDQHGTGRVLFRNTRAALDGFPERKVNLIPLEESFTAWLVAFFKKRKEKTLLICRTREKAEAVEAALREQTSLPVALFHEGLSLLERDRNAASFADEEGVRCLICSEIGSEGRNFQFARHLVLIDLPENPELLEQRIGRLDRIGQTGAIHIHVPYAEGSADARLARWFHEGMNAFEENLHGGAELYARFRDPLAADLDALIAETRAVYAEIRERLAAGEDRLLEIHNRRAAGATPLADAIRTADADTALDDFLLEAFDYFGANVEEIAPRTWIVTPSSELPGIPKEGITLTADRRRALERENETFLTGDHPAVRGLFEMLLGTTKGNAALAQTGQEGVVAEAVYVLEVIAPAELHADRFLAATPLRVWVDNRLAERTAPAKLADAPLGKVLGKTELCYKLLPKMLDHAESLARRQAMKTVAASLAALQETMGAEVDRLRDLAAPAREIEAAQTRLYDLRDAIADARLRLDAVRLIFPA